MAHGLNPSTSPTAIVNRGIPKVAGATGPTNGSSIGGADVGAGSSSLPSIRAGHGHVQLSSSASSRLPDVSARSNPTSSRPPNEKTGTLAAAIRCRRTMSVRSDLASPSCPMSANDTSNAGYRLAISPSQALARLQREQPSRVNTVKASASRSRDMTTREFWACTTTTSQREATGRCIGSKPCRTESLRRSSRSLSLMPGNRRTTTTPSRAAANSLTPFRVASVAESCFSANTSIVTQRRGVSASATEHRGAITIAKSDSVRRVCRCATAVYKARMAGLLRLESNAMHKGERD